MEKTYSKKNLVVIMISVFIGACLSFMSEEVQAAEKIPLGPLRSLIRSVLEPELIFSFERLLKS